MHLHKAPPGDGRGDLLRIANVSPPRFETSMAYVQ